jgi:3'-5' exoribonuclease
MTRRYVNELSDGETVDQVFLASEKQLRPNRNGNLYLQVRLSDKTGSLTAMMWNATQKHYESFNNGDYIRVVGTSQFYNGGMQVLAKDINVTDPAKVHQEDFVNLSKDQVEKMSARVAQLLRSIRNVHLRNVSECFLVDDNFMRQFRRAPAGIKNHHAYQGGLLEHVLSLMELAAVVAPRYPRLDPDLLLIGAFIHDIGKVRELNYQMDLSYTDAGQMIGHLIQGVTMLEEKIQETVRQTGESFPEDLANRLKHMIVSHHGQHEFGSPKLPMTLEAIALHYLDTLDAKIHFVLQLIDEDANKDSVWTVYNSQLARKIYKGH